jgi:hypothetical protein
MMQVRVVGGNRTPLPNVPSLRRFLSSTDPGPVLFSFPLGFLALETSVMLFC